MSLFSKDESAVIQGIIEVCRSLHQRNLLAAADGNVSYRISDERILITPSGRNKAFLTERDMAIITLDDRVIEGQPSSERLMHLAVYERCPKARAVVHAHPPTAIAWSIASPEMTELPAQALPEVILAAGRIPIVPYARPSTRAMGTNLYPFLPEHRLFVLARHGGLCWGESLMEAYNGMERLEHAALILKLAKELGGLHPLAPEELQALRELRAKNGEKIL